MDVQVSIVQRVVPKSVDLLATIARAIAGARIAGVRVIFVTVSFRDGHPEVNSDNTVFSGIATRGEYLRSQPTTQIHSSISPAPGDIVVAKHRVSAFSGSDLELVLRAQRVETLVLAGIATSGVVLSTVRAAADLDFRLAVLADGCADRDPEVHRVLLEKIFPSQAEVITVDEWLAQISGTGGSSLSGPLVR